MFEQSELVMRYTLYCSALYCLEVCPLMDPSQGDGDGSETKCGGESLLRNNEVCVYSLTGVFCSIFLNSEVIHERCKM
jgi:hypothetical protein